MTQGFQERLANMIIRHPEPDRGFVALQDLRNLLTGRQDERKGSGQVTFQQPVQGGIDPTGIVTELTQVAANKGELGLMRIHLFNGTDPFNGFMIHDITTQSVNGIGWINDDAAILQAFGHLLYETGLRIFWMDLDQHVI